MAKAPPPKINDSLLLPRLGQHSELRRASAASSSGGYVKHAGRLEESMPFSHIIYDRASRLLSEPARKCFQSYRVLAAEHC